MANSSQKISTVNSTTQIFEILTATIESLKEIDDLIVKNNINEKTIDKLKLIVQGEVDIIKIIIDNSKTFISLNNVILNDKNIKKLLSTIKYIFIELKNLSKILGKSPIASKTIIKSLLGLQEILIQILEIQKIVSKIKIVKSSITLILLPIFLFNLGLLSISLIALGVIFIVLIPMTPIIKFGLFSLSEIIDILAIIFNAIASIKIIKAAIQLKIIPYLIKDMIDMLKNIWILSEITVQINKDKIFEFLIIWNLLAGIFIKIGEIKTLWLKMTLKAINKCLILLFEITSELNRLKVRKNVLKNIFQLNIIFVLLSTLFSTILIVAIPATLFLLGYPILFLATLGLLPLVKLINIISKKVKIKSIIGILNLAIISMALLAVMTALSLIAIVAATIDITNVLKAILILGIYLVFIVLLKLVSKLLDVSIIGVFLILSISAIMFTIIIGAIYLISIIAATIDITNVLKAMLVLGIYIGFMILLNFFKSQIIVGVMVLILLSVSLILLSISLLLINKAVEGITLENIGIFSAIMGVIIGFAVALSFMPFIFIGIGVIMALSISLILFSTGLKMLMSVGFTEKDSEKVIEPIKAFETIADYLSNSDADFSKASKKAKKLASISIQVGKMAKVLQDVASLKIPTKFDKNGNPTEFQQMSQDDFVVASENISLIMITLLKGMTVYKSEATGGKTVAEMIEDLSIKSMIKLKFLFNAISNIKHLVNVIQQMANMSIPVKFDKNGNPTEFRNITEQERTAAMNNVVTLMTEVLKAISNPELTEVLTQMDNDAAENISIILESCSGISGLVDAIIKSTNIDEEKLSTGISIMKTSLLSYFGAISDLFISKKAWEIESTKVLGITLKYPIYKVIAPAEIDTEHLSDVIESMEDFAKTVDPFKNLISIVKTLADEKSTDINSFDNISNFITKYAQSILGNEKGEGGIIISEDGKKRISRFVLLINTTDKFAKINSANLQKNADTFIKFIDKANSINTDKIKSIRDMFEQIARFSESIKGNFDKLADVLSEKLVDVLANINETIGNINSNKSGNNISNISSNNAVNTNTSAQETKRNIEQMNKLVSIADSLEDILSVLKEVRENTDYQYKI